MRGFTWFMAAAIAFGQQAAPTATLERVTSAMQDYARGVTENRFDVSCRLTGLDAAGKVRKVRNTTHTLEFTKGSYKSASEGSEPEWTGTFTTRGGRRTIGLETMTDFGAFSPVAIFSPGSRKKFDFRSADSEGVGAIEVSFAVKDSCQAFQASGGGSFKMVNGSCASGRVVLDPAAAVPLRITLEGGGFPVSLGKSSMSRYHVESEFQMVSLAGAKRPFLFPSKSVATFVFDGEPETVECGYTFHAGRKR